MPKKKTGNDYPMLGYRVMPAIKYAMTDLLEETLDLYNSDLSEEEKAYKKNDIFVMALKTGLEKMKKQKKG